MHYDLQSQGRGPIFFADRLDENLACFLAELIGEPLQHIHALVAIEFAAKDAELNALQSKVQAGFGNPVSDPVAFDVIHDESAKLFYHLNENALYGSPPLKND